MARNPIERMFPNGFSGEMKWTFRDYGYLMPKCTALIDGDGTLRFRLSGGGYHIDFEVDGYWDRTALEVEAQAVSEHGELGRHFHDCLFAVYGDLGLDFGYVENPLKEVEP